MVLEAESCIDLLHGYLSREQIDISQNTNTCMSSSYVLRLPSVFKRFGVLKGEKSIVRVSGAGVKKGYFFCTRFPQNKAWKLRSKITSPT